MADRERINSAMDLAKTISDKADILIRKIRGIRDNNINNIRQGGGKRKTRRLKKSSRRTRRR